MKLIDPVVVYTAESNIQAQMVEQFLESEGVASHAVEDNSLVGYWAFGRLAEIHKPQVWVGRADFERAAELVREYEHLLAQRDALRQAGAAATIDVECEDCNRTSQFPASLNGTVQECPHCRCYVDVGEFDWPDEDMGETEDE